jgi:hypothetical protein
MCEHVSMAGGWSKRGTGIPLEQRTRAGSTAPHPPVDDEACPARHCWVAGALDAEGVKRPGLLVEWRQTEPGWQGRVLYCARLRRDAWVVVEEWLPADLLTPL